VHLPTFSKAQEAAAAAREEEAKAAAARAEPLPLTNTLMCLQLTAEGKPREALLYLTAAVRGFKQRGGRAPGVPRRTAGVLAVEAASYLIDAALPGLAQAALDLAAKSEVAALAKVAGVPRVCRADAPVAELVGKFHEAAARVEAGLTGDGGGDGEEPLTLRQARLLVSARLALLNGDAAGARPLAEEAVSLEPRDAAAWAVLAEALYSLGALGEAAAAYTSCLEQRRKSAPPSVPSRREFLRLGHLHLQLGRFDSARQVKTCACFDIFIRSLFFYIIFFK